MNNEENEFLQGLNQADQQFEEPESVFGEKPKEEEVEEEEKPLPFHKDPKVQRYIQKEIEKAQKSQPSANAHSAERQFIEDTQQDDDEGTAILERIIGNDTPEKVAAIKDFKRYLSSLEEKGADRALYQLSQQEEEARQEEAQASEEIEQGFEDIEETFGVDLSSNSPTARRTRNDFIDFIKRVAPKDRDGDVIALPDLTETFDLYQSTRQKPSNTRAKELATRSMARSNNASDTPQEKEVSWKTVDKWLGGLSR